MNRFSVNKRGILLIILLMLSTHSYLVAQESMGQQESFLKQLRYGGSLGLNFGNDYFNGYLAPRALYDFNALTSAGIGVAGSYTNASNFTGYSLSGSLLGMLRPLPNIQLSAEFEESYVSRELEMDGGNLKDSYWYPALYAGLGYTTGPVTVGIRYDLLYDDEKSLYNNAFMPFVSVYF